MYLIIKKCETMKKLNLKLFLSLFLLFFISFGCEEQISSTPKKLSAEVLLKDKAFVNFIEVVREMHQKVIYRQRDLGTFPKVEGSIKKIRDWGKSEESALQNKELIVQELGFEDWNEYINLEKVLEDRRAIFTRKFPNFVNLPNVEKESIFLQAIEKLDKIPQARTSHNVICPQCFFNSCDHCGNLPTYKSEFGQYGGGCDNTKLENCKANKAVIRDASKNLALVAFLTYVAATCGPFGAQVAAAGAVATGGPGALIGFFAFSGCTLPGLVVYHETLRLIEASYRDGIMDCEDKYGC